MNHNKNSTVAIRQFVATQKKKKKKKKYVACIFTTKNTPFAKAISNIKNLI